MKQTTQQKIKENITKRSLRILKANSGMKTMELFKAVYNRSPQFSIDKVGHDLATEWQNKIFNVLLDLKQIVPVGGFGKGYMVNKEVEN